jgi:hypothetical protein
VLHDDVEGLFDVGNEYMSVLDIDAELAFDGFVDLDGGFDVDVSAFISPVGHEADGDTLRYSIGTFHRSGSNLLRRLLMTLMRRLAVRPG